MDPQLREIRRQQWLQSQQSAASSSSTAVAKGTTCTDPIIFENNNNIQDTSTISNNIKVVAKKQSSITASTAVVDLTLSDDENVSPPPPPPTNPPSKRKRSITSSKKMNSKRKRQGSTSSKDGITSNTKSNSSSLSSSSSSSSSKCPFSICTYNLWFQPVHVSKRMSQISTILANLEDNKPTFIGLQEVTAELKMELFPLLESMGYQMICQPGYNLYYVAIGILGSSSGGSFTGVGRTLGSTTATYNENDGVGGVTSAQILSSGFHPYKDSNMGRGLLYAHVQLTASTTSSTSFSSSNNENTKQILFTTTHLESYVRIKKDTEQNLFTTTHLESYMRYDGYGKVYEGTTQRVSQMGEATTFCNQFIANKPSSSTAIDMAFIAGDLNWDDERKRSQGLDPPLLSVVVNPSSTTNTKTNNKTAIWRDCWREARGERDEGYTYDSKENAMLKGSLRRRLDRCLVLTSEISEMNIQKSKMIGTKIIHGITYDKQVQIRNGGRPSGKTRVDSRPALPSDHFGLYFKFGG